MLLLKVSAHIRVHVWAGTFRRDIFDIYVVAYSVAIFVGACLVCFLLGCSGFGKSSLRPCHTTTYSTNVCRRMKNSASTLVYAEYVRNKF